VSPKRGRGTNTFPRSRFGSKDNHRQFSTRNRPSRFFTRTGSVSRRSRYTATPTRPAGSTRRRRPARAPPSGRARTCAGEQQQRQDVGREHRRPGQRRRFDLDTNPLASSTSRRRATPTRRARRIPGRAVVEDRDRQRPADQQAAQPEAELTRSVSRSFSRASRDDQAPAARSRRPRRTLRLLPRRQHAEGLHGQEREQALGDGQTTYHRRQAGCRTSTAARIETTVSVTHRPTNNHCTSWNASRRSPSNTAATNATDNRPLAQSKAALPRPRRPPREPVTDQEQQTQDREGERVIFVVPHASNLNACQTAAHAVTVAR